VIWHEIQQAGEAQADTEPIDAMASGVGEGLSGDEVMGDASGGIGGHTPKAPASRASQGRGVDCGGGLVLVALQRGDPFLALLVRLAVLDAREALFARLRV